VSTPSWLADTSASYDTVAESYEELFREGLAPHPYVRATLALFAELLRDIGGPVLDAGCGPGHLTAHLRDLGVEAFGVDLSPGMVAIARRDHPDLRFEVGSMTDLNVPDRSVGGVLAYYSLIHVPDDEVPAVLGHFYRVLRPGGIVMIGFHVGDEHRHKTQGYGGHPMNLYVHRRPVDRMAIWLRDAGLTVEAHLLTDPDDPVPGAAILARRPTKNPAA
jgi:ubiquinone/menaquinone biosynthesis C-methylase UbiE